MSWMNIIDEKKVKKDINYTKLDEGTTLVRILSEEPHGYWNHYIAPTRTGMVCLGKGCPACETRKTQKDAGLQPSIGISKRFAVWVWNYKTEQVEVMFGSKTFFIGLASLEEEEGDIRNYDVKIKRMGKGTDTTYSFIPSMNNKKTFEEVYPGYKDLAPLEEIVKPPTLEEARQLVEGKSWGEIRGTKEESIDPIPEKTNAMETASEELELEGDLPF